MRYGITLTFAGAIVTALAAPLPAQTTRQNLTSATAALRSVGKTVAARSLANDSVSDADRLELRAAIQASRAAIQAHHKAFLDTVTTDAQVLERAEQFYRTRWDD